MTKNIMHVETSRVKETVSMMQKNMLAKGILYNIDIQPVKGDKNLVRLVFTD